jgi:hypothetical protein
MVCADGFTVVGTTDNEVQYFQFLKQLNCCSTHEFWYLLHKSVGLLLGVETHSDAVNNNGKRRRLGDCGRKVDKNGVFQIRRSAPCSALQWNGNQWVAKVRRFFFLCDHLSFFKEIITTWPNEHLPLPAMKCSFFSRDWSYGSTWALFPTLLLPPSNRRLLPPKIFPMAEQL